MIEDLVLEDSLYMPCDCVEDVEEDDYPDHDIVEGTKTYSPAYYDDEGNECIDVKATYKCRNCGTLHTYTRTFKNGGDSTWEEE